MHYDYIAPNKNKDSSWTGSIIQVPGEAKRVIGQEAKEVKIIRLVTGNSEVEVIEEMKKIIKDLKKET